MDISVRSYLTAGVAAAVGATAIGLTPTQPTPDLHAVALPVSTVAEIALTGTSIPWATIAAVVQAISSGGSLQDGVTALIGSIGAEFVKQALPVVTAAAGDVVKFVGTTLAELLSGPDAPEIDFEAILQAASEAINAGNLPGAVQALVSGLSAPLTQISQVLFTTEFQEFVIGKVGSVLGAVPEILRAAVETVVGIDIKPLIDALTGLIGGILPAATVVAAPRVLAAATGAVDDPAAVVESVAAPEAPAAAAVPEAVPAAPAEDQAGAEADETAAPAGDAAPAADPAEAAAAEVEVEVEAAAADADPAEAAAADPVGDLADEPTDVKTSALDAGALETDAPATTRAGGHDAAESADTTRAPRVSKAGARHSSEKSVAGRR